MFGRAIITLGIDPHSSLNLISVIACSKMVHNITQTKFKLVVLYHPVQLHKNYTALQQIHKNQTAESPSERLSCCQCWRPQGAWVHHWLLHLVTNKRPCIRHLVYYALSIIMVALCNRADHNIFFSLYSARL